MGRGSAINSVGCKAPDLGSGTERGSEAYSEEVKAVEKEMTMVQLSEEALEGGWDWVRALSSGERSEKGSEEVLASPQELESVVSLG